MGGVNASRARRLTASGVSEAGPRNAEASAADKTSGGSRPRGTSYSSRPGTQVPAVIEGRRGRANRKKERNQKQRENEAQREREIRPPEHLLPDSRAATNPRLTARESKRATLTPQARNAPNRWPVQRASRRFHARDLNHGVARVNRPKAPRPDYSLVYSRGCELGYRSRPAAFR